MSEQPTLHYGIKTFAKATGYNSVSQHTAHRWHRQQIYDPIRSL